LSQQLRENADRVAVAARAGIVLCIGENDRSSSRRRIGDGICDRLPRLPELFAEPALARQHLRRDLVGGFGRRRFRVAVSDNRGAAILDVGGRKTRGERDSADATIAQYRAVEISERAIEMRRWLRQRALRRQRNQIIDLPQRLGLFRQSRKYRIEMGRGLRPGLRHIDVGIGTISNQRIGIGDHFIGDIGMKIETRDKRDFAAYRAPHARENFAFTVVEMLADHRAVQI
jgi:hypothetical protein